MTTKQNPKYIQAQKDGKIPLEYLVTSVLALDAAVHKHGADKYGVRNWRLDEILASTYEGAMMRHLFAWISGEDLDPDSGKPHLTHLRACCAVVLDAQMHDKLVDDRGRMESKGSPPVIPTAADIEKLAASIPGSNGVNDDPAIGGGGAAEPDAVYAVAKETSDRLRAEAQAVTAWWVNENEAPPMPPGYREGCPCISCVTDRRNTLGHVEQETAKPTRVRNDTSEHGPSFVPCDEQSCIVCWRDA